MKTGLRVEGFDDTDANLSRLSDMANPEELRALGFDALEPVAEAARGLVRSRTGRLKRSIETGDRLSPAQAAGNQPDPGTVEVYVGPGSMPQAITEEFGTIHEAGHPYLRPAWDGQLATVVARLRQGTGARLRRLTGG